MFSMFFTGVILLFIALFIFKVFFFVFGVLLAGAGFIIKALALFLFMPCLPVALFILGGLLPTSTIILIILTASIISYSNRRYRCS